MIVGIAGLQDCGLKAESCAVRRWRLLAGAAALQVVVAAVVRLTPVSNLSRTARRVRGLGRAILCGASGTEDGSHDEARVIWAIEATGRRLPRIISTCLVRAIVAEILMASRDRPVQVRIGVRQAPHGSGEPGRPDGERGLEGHAWVERDGRALIGEPGEDLFVPLIGWESYQAWESDPQHESGTA